MEATGPGGALVTYASPGTFDVVDVDLVASCLPASNTVMTLGPHTITCNATDASGNVADATTFTVTVRDTVKPVIDTHIDEFVEAAGPGGALVTYASPGTFDVVDVDLVASCLPASNTVMTLGPHTITCNATDASGNVADATTFTVTVRDTVKPVIDTHIDEFVEATGPGGALVTYASPGTFDVVDVDLVASAPASNTS